MDCIRRLSVPAVPEIGLFPLELVLLPGERVPLHIFEDRYRELIGECLADGTEFGLILEDADGLRQVGTSTGVVELVHNFDDGRMNVLVEGRSRFRVVELTDGRAFRTAEVEPLEDDDEEPPTPRPSGRWRCSAGCRGRRGRARSTIPPATTRRRSRSSSRPGSTSGTS